MRIVSTLLKLNKHKISVTTTTKINIPPILYTTETRIILLCSLDSWEIVSSSVWWVHFQLHSQIQFNRISLLSIGAPVGGASIKYN